MQDIQSMTASHSLNQKAVIFDMDGVLVDTEPIYMGVSHRILKKLGIVIPLERFHSYVGIPMKDVWSDIRKNFGLKDSVTHLLELEKEEQLRELKALDEIPIVTGVINLINEIEKRKFSLGVGSSSPRSVIELILSKTGLLNHFQAIVSAEDVVNGKPAPDIFLEVARRLRCMPPACIVIEDSPHGVAAAKSAGMKVVGFKNENSGDQNLLQADLIVKDFTGKHLRQVVHLASRPS